MPQFSAQSTIQEVAEAYPDKLTGRTFLVTGATNGLGLAFTKFIASQGAKVIVTGRSDERLTKALNEIKPFAEDPKSVKGIVMDNADLESIRRAALEINLLEEKTDVLVNNAGIALVPFKLVNGYESQIAVNHLAHFLFTNLILGSVKDGGRIINISSSAHRRSPVRFDDINFENGKSYDKWLGYGQSKSANILFSESLTKKLKHRKIESFSLHPGSIMTTGLASHTDPKVEGLQDANGNWTIPVINENQGISTYLYACISPDIEGEGGAYLSACSIQSPMQPLTDEDAEKLWDISNGILRTTY